MKATILLFAITLFTIFPAHSQSIVGTYTNTWESKSGEALVYTLTLNEDSTFEFQSERTLLAPDSEITSEASGTWKLNGHLLVLSTDSNDELSSGLNNCKARFVNISPRNPKFNLVKPSLKFYPSEVFYAKNMKLNKEESTVTSIDSVH